MNSPWAAVPFASSLTGPADQTTLTGDAQPATVFVPISNPTGFYAVTIKTTSL